MSNLLEAVAGQLGGNILTSMTSQLGARPEQTQSAMSAALPILLSALAKNSSSKQGAESLFNALNKDHDGSILDNLGGFLGSASQGPGAGILKHVLGGNKGNVEQAISKSSGLDVGSAGKMLEMLAPVVLGVLGRQQKQQGLNVASLASLLGETRQQVDNQSPKEMGLINKLLDADGDGSITDDVANLGMKFLGGLFSGKR